MWGCLCFEKRRSCKSKHRVIIVFAAWFGQGWELRNGSNIRHYVCTWRSPLYGWCVGFQFIWNSVKLCITVIWQKFTPTIIVKFAVQISACKRAGGGSWSNVWAWTREDAWWKRLSVWCECSVCRRSTCYRWHRWANGDKDCRCCNSGCCDHRCCWQRIMMVLAAALSAFCGGERREGIKRFSA